MYQTDQNATKLITKCIEPINYSFIIGLISGMPFQQRMYCISNIFLQTAVEAIQSFFFPVVNFILYF